MSRPDAPEYTQTGTKLPWPRGAACSIMRAMISRQHPTGAGGVDPAGHLHDLVREHPDFEVLHEPTLNLYCFRYVPNGLAERLEEGGVQALLDRLNREIVEAVRRGGLTSLTTTRVGGRVALRVSGGSHGTSEGDVEAAFEAIARWGRLLTKSHSVRYEKPAEMEAPRCSSESCSSPTEVSAT